MVNNIYMPDKFVRKELDRLVNGLIMEKKSPGVAYSVFGPNGMLLSRGLGIADETDANLSVDSVFRIASMSKSFTAASILKLDSEGMLSIHDPVAKTIPEYKGAVQYGDDAMPVTIAMLLSMSSGMATDDPWADRQESISRERLRAIIDGGLRFVFRPGDGFEYSNAGFAILGEIVNRITGKPVMEYVKKNFLEPLGLEHTGYDYRKLGKNRATGFSWYRNGWKAEPFTQPGAFSSIGGVLSTVSDMAKWGIWLESAFSSENGECDSILPKRYRRMMQTGHVAIPPTIRSGSSRGRLCMTDSSAIASYGYGLFVEHDPVYGDICYHPGGYPGFGSVMCWHKDSGLGVIVLANGRYAPANVIGMRMLRVILADASAVGRTITPWKETLDAKSLILKALERLANSSEDDLESACKTVFSVLRPYYSENIEMDADLEYRADLLADALRQSGPVKIDGNGRVLVEKTSIQTEACVSWTVRCERLPLFCTVRMNPLAKPEIETIDFKVESKYPISDVLETSMTTQIAE